jgi:hypothetical protein
MLIITSCIINHINAICISLGKNKSMALPIFHRFTGCDSCTSAFFEKGKRTVWEAWKSYPEVTEAFLHMARHPHSQVTEESQHFQLLEQFSVILYEVIWNPLMRHGKSCSASQKSKTIINGNLFRQHRMLCYNTVNVLGWNLNWHNNRHLATPEGNGWTLHQGSKSWAPVWTTIVLNRSSVAAKV